MNPILRSIGGAAAVLGLVAATSAQAASISPMVDVGVTFSDKKGLMVDVANPYGSTQNFVLEAFEPDLSTPAPDVSLSLTELTLASNARRRVRVIFPVPGEEREIAVCVRPQDIDRLVVPRVCGRYLARRVGAR